MYAIIRDGGRQHRVAEGDTIAIDRVDLKKGDQVEFAEVLLVSDEGKVSVGAPLVEGAKVLGEVKEGLSPAKKVFAVMFKRRKNSRRKVGHRQKYTEVTIKSVVAP